MDNKEQFKEAIHNIEKYSKAQSKVADVLVDLAVNYETIASAKYIIDKTNLTRPTVYAALDLFQKDSILTKNKNFKNTYIFNKERIQKIIDYYKHKKELTI
jgi:Fe2+ or Zn2+ uptake regulation protein